LEVSEVRRRVSDGCHVFLLFLFPVELKLEIRL